MVSVLPGRYPGNAKWRRHSQPALSKRSNLELSAGKLPTGTCQASTSSCSPPGQSHGPCDTGTPAPRVNIRSAHTRSSISSPHGALPARHCEPLPKVGTQAARKCKNAQPSQTPSRPWQGSSSSGIANDQTGHALPGKPNACSICMCCRAGVAGWCGTSSAATCSTCSTAWWTAANQLPPIGPSSPSAGVKPPTAERSRDRVLTDQELRAVWQAADKIGGTFGALVRLLILTG